MALAARFNCVALYFSIRKKEKWTTVVCVREVKKPRNVTGHENGTLVFVFQKLNDVL